jgi:hypothetical protein
VPPFGFRIRALIPRGRLPETAEGNETVVSFGDNSATLSIAQRTAQRPGSAEYRFEGGFRAF